MPVITSRPCQSAGRGSPTFTETIRMDASPFQAETISQRLLYPRFVMFPRLAVLLLPLLLAALTRPEPAVRHIVVLSIDTLRADAVSPSATPAIAALARDSVTFTRAFSPAPWTLPALASVMTGVSPQVHQATGLGGRLPGRLTTLAEALRRDGFRTEAIVSNQIGRAHV